MQLSNCLDCNLTSWCKFYLTQKSWGGERFFSFFWPFPRRTLTRTGAWLPITKAPWTGKEEKDPHLSLKISPLAESEFLTENVVLGKTKLSAVFSATQRLHSLICVLLKRVSPSGSRSFVLRPQTQRWLNCSSFCCNKWSWTFYFSCDKSKVDNHSFLQITWQYRQSKRILFFSSFKLIVSYRPGMIYQTTEIVQFHPTAPSQKNYKAFLVV